MDEQAQKHCITIAQLKYDGGICVVSFDYPNLISTVSILFCAHKVT